MLKSAEPRQADSSAVRDAYRLLHLPVGASLEAVRTSYHRLIKQIHPDSTPDVGVARERGYQVSAIVAAYRLIASRQVRLVQPLTIHEISMLGEQLLHAADPAARLFAARRLGWGGRRAAYGYLKTALVDEQDADVLVAVVEAVGDLRVGQAIHDLTAAFGRAEPAIQAHILTICTYSHLVDRSRHLAALGMLSPQAEVRRPAIHLSRLQGDEGHDGG